MKKLLIALLFVSFLTPALATADNGYEGGQGQMRNPHKAFQAIHQALPKPIVPLNLNNGNKYHQATSTAPGLRLGTGPSFFLCKTSTGWTVVSYAAGQTQPTATAGNYCMKLPTVFAKLYASTSTPPTIPVVTPDVTAPIISAITVSSVASTTAAVSWTTNELATGKLYYGTSTPLTLFGSNATLSLTHSFNLTGLTASTTYNLLLESSDAVGNVATTTSLLTTTN